MFQQFLVLVHPLRVVKFYPIFRVGCPMLPGPVGRLLSPALSLMGQQGRGWGTLSLNLGETHLGGL